MEPKMTAMSIAGVVSGSGHRRWAENLFHALAPMTLPGRYPNMLGPDQRHLVALDYGCTTIRLQRAKQRFNSDRVFTSAAPLL
jgi:hypothetical protein